MSSSDASNCEICGIAEFRYTCPKCNFRYCSVDCYKSPKHIKCSEEFYKSCIQEELSGNEPRSREDIRKIYEILKRIREVDLGADGNDFTNAVDSDDDDDVEQLPQEDCVGSDEEDEIDLATRLQGVDLNDPDEVWKNLSEAERLEFQKMIDCGDIMKLIPNYKPWWIKDKEPKIVEIQPNSDKCITQNQEPKIVDNIKKLTDLCTKEPSPCVHYNLWNILSSYSCIARFFGGEHLNNAYEASAHLVNLCSTLKYGTNFEDADDAILSVEAEALTTGNGASAFGSLFIESREQLKEDARLLMSTTRFKLIALSDIHNLFQLAKAKSSNFTRKESDYQKIFALRNGSIEIDRLKLKQLLKKIEFLLSYVSREKGLV